jgi:ribonuclease P protein component
LTLFGACRYLFKLVSRRRFPIYRATRNEADVQAAQPQARQQARVPCEDEDQGWSRDVVAPPPEGSRASHGEGGKQVDPQRSGDGEPGFGERLPGVARIRRTREIRALLERGKRKRTTHLDVFFAPSPASFSRLGLIVPKHGRKIVERNLLKRRLREIGRRRVLPALAARGAAFDVLVRARHGAYTSGFDTLVQEMSEAVEGMC